MKLVRPRTLRRCRQALVVAAALPLFQLSMCSSAVSWTTLMTASQVPSFILNSYASALLDTLFSAIGLNNLFGNFGGGFGNNNNNNNFGGGNNFFGGGNNNVGGGNTGLGGTGGTGVGGTGVGGTGVGGTGTGAGGSGT